MRRFTLSGVCAVIVMVAAACGSKLDSYQGSISEIDLGVCAPGGEFTLDSTNPYFPIEVGKQWVLEGGDERVIITVLDETEVVAGVTTRVIEEREWEDGEVKEVSRNYFAQASDGTVCYFGEAVVPEEGVWRADNPGSQPGIIMPARPTPGQRFKMEVEAGQAEDEGLIYATGEIVDVPAGTFSETIRLLEFNPIDGEEEYKFYAAGVGLLIDENLKLVSY